MDGSEQKIYRLIKGICTLVVIRVRVGVIENKLSFKRVFEQVC